MSLAIDESQLGMAEALAPGNIRAYLAELVGTLLFVAISSAVVIVLVAVDADPAGFMVASALASGIAIATMMYLTQRVSGGHLNPAITLGMMVTGKIKIAPGILYMVAQFAGAALATLVLYVILVDAVGNISDFGANAINTAAIDGDGGALLLLLVLTATLVMVFMVTAAAKDGINYGIMGPLAIGLTVVAVELVGVMLAGSSVNPARTFGPAVVSDAFSSFWVFIVGPALGGGIGALLIYHVFLRPAGDN